MCKCLNPDERLFDCKENNAITERVNKLEDYWLGNRRFPFGICGAMWYGTPVVSERSHDKVKWRYGVELEVEFHRVSFDGKTEWAEYPNRAAIIANHHLGLRTRWTGGGITEDHYLDRGWEVILPAMSINKVCEYLAEIIADDHIAPYLRHNGNASLHITVDPFDTPKQQRAFHDFWNHPEFFEDFSSITHRKENSYCRRRQKPKGRISQFMTADPLRNHYHRCNTRKNGAMEVRVFQAVYNIEVIRQQLRMVDIVNKAIRSGELDYEGIKARIYKGRDLV